MEAVSDKTYPTFWIPTKSGSNYGMFCFMMTCGKNQSTLDNPSPLRTSFFSWPKVKHVAINSLLETSALNFIVRWNFLKNDFCLLPFCFFYPCFPDPMNYSELH